MRVRGVDVKYKYKTKFLAVHLTEDTKCDVHITNLSSKLNRSYCIMHSLKGITSVNILRGLYFASFHSYVRYGILF